MASSRILRDLAWRLEAMLYDAASAVLRLLPVDWVSDAGAVLFKLLGPLTPSHAIAARNLELAFPDLDGEARAALLKAQWDSVGRTFFEFPISDRLTPASGRVAADQGRAAPAWLAAPAQAPEAPTPAVRQ